MESGNLGRAAAKATEVWRMAVTHLDSPLAEDPGVGSMEGYVIEDPFYR